MPIRAVFFDIGATLISEDRLWARWADWLGVPHLTFFAAMGSAIERDERLEQVFEYFKPGFNLEEEEAARAAAGVPNVFDANDLYPDAVPCLQALKDAGLFVGLAGNQPASAEGSLRVLDLPVEVIGVSAAWGVAKPSPEFFAKLTQIAALPPAEIAYVGDRLDNDVLPAKEAGMVSVFLRRGPWGVIHARRPEAALADIRIDSLTELLGALQTY